MPVTSILARFAISSSFHSWFLLSRGQVLLSSVEILLLLLHLLLLLLDLNPLCAWTKLFISLRGTVVHDYRRLLVIYRLLIVMSIESWLAILSLIVDVRLRRRRSRSISDSNGLFISIGWVCHRLCVLEILRSIIPKFKTLSTVVFPVLTSSMLIFSCWRTVISHRDVWLARNMRSHRWNIRPLCVGIWHVGGQRFVEVISCGILGISWSFSVDNLRYILLFLYHVLLNLSQSTVECVLILSSNSLLHASWFSSIRRL